MNQACICNCRQCAHPNTCVFDLPGEGDKELWRGSVYEHTSQSVRQVAVMGVPPLCELLVRVVAEQGK